MKFEVYQGTDGNFYWRLRAKNGETIAQGEGYARKADALKAVKLIQSVSVKGARTIVLSTVVAKPVTQAPDHVMFHVRLAKSVLAGRVTLVKLELAIGHLQAARQALGAVLTAEAQTEVLLAHPEKPTVTGAVAAGSVA